MWKVQGITALIKDHVEVIQEKANNLSTDGQEWLWDVNRRHGVPQQHYSVEMKVSGGGQVTRTMSQLHGSRSSGAGLHKSKKWTKVWVVPRDLQAHDEEHDIKKFQPINAWDAEDGENGGGICSPRIIVEDKFRGSTLDLFQAYDVFQQPGSPELGTVTKLGANQWQVQMWVQRIKVVEMRMSYKRGGGNDMP